jgi:hypothetical protein
MGMPINEMDLAFSSTANLRSNSNPKENVCSLLIIAEIQQAQHENSKHTGKFNLQAIPQKRLTCPFRLKIIVVH